MIPEMEENTRVLLRINRTAALYAFKTHYKNIKRIFKNYKLHKYAKTMNKYVAKLKKLEYNQFMNF